MKVLVHHNGAELLVLADFPAGPGPFAAIVLAPGQAYAKEQPALAQTARQMVLQGVAVFRFDWAYPTVGPNAGSPSADLSDELQTLEAVIGAARADPRVDPTRVSVGGKSMGTVVAWQALQRDKALKAGLLLTPICTRLLPGQASPTDVADGNYPGASAETRPLLFIAGDRDPLCRPQVLYRFATHTGGPARVAIVGGDHRYAGQAYGHAGADEASARNIDAVARLAADFIVEVTAAQNHRTSAA